MELTSRELLTHLFHTAIESVDGRYLVNRWCRESTHKFSHVIAVGKAAPAMMQGVIDSAVRFQQALLICPHRSASRALRKDTRIEIHEAAHPVPDESSLHAGDALLRFVQTLPEDSQLLVLISGGTSSLVEALREGVTLDDMQAINRYLLASGKDIHAMNAWRKRFSKIKGGGLLAQLHTHACTQLLISDVRGDDAAVIGSGLLCAGDDKTDPDDWLQNFIERLPVTSQEHLHRAVTVDTRIIGSQRMALLAAAGEARQMGLDVDLHDEFIGGDALEAGRRLAHWLLEHAPPGIHLWGAETTVKLPERPGIGGRNQAFALALAATLADADRESDDIGVLAAGTDGIDGNTTCAGAVVFASTARQIRQSGYDIDAELAGANSGTLLMSTADLLKTGATGTNVMDLIISWKQA